MVIVQISTTVGDVSSWSSSQGKKPAWIRLNLPMAIGQESNDDAENNDEAVFRTRWL